MIPIILFLSIQFRKKNWDPEENFEILNKKKKRQKIGYLAMPETYGNIRRVEWGKTPMAGQTSTPFISGMV